jgi:hypothetical protein
LKEGKDVKEGSIGEARCTIPSTTKKKEGTNEF